jgi:catechol 2,3-dioxygenase-like lactoylglutathione lyase family enzyme
MLKIDLTSILVDDQEKAHDFYTSKLGFQTKVDIPAGGARWLTVVSPDDPDGTQLLLEPDGNPAIQIEGEPAAQVFKQTLYNAGIPFTSLGSDDIQGDFERMSSQGVVFTMEPTEMGGVTIAVFDDTCGNLIQLHQAH